MRNVALYGGAFDPPHIGHIRLVQSLLKTKTVDEVWLMPCGDREDKKLLLSMNKRFYLMKLLFENTPNIKISDDQIQMSKQKGGAVHTYDLIAQMRKKYEWANFIIVVGGDVMHTIHTWGKSDRLQQENPFIIFSRKGYQIPPDKLPPQNTIIQSQLPEISSSYIKKLIQDESVPSEEKQKILKPWLDERVLSFLLQEKVI